MLRFFLPTLFLTICLVGCKQENIGMEAHLSSNGTGDVLVAIDQSALSTWSIAVKTKDFNELSGLIMSGKLFSVKDGIKVRVVDKVNEATKIHILEGDRAGNSGWVLNQSLKMDVAKPAL